ncbi:MAG: ATP-binding cassette domain-containing protein [Euryarchaeota archaeon]|nr:ABC transporter ATP-binding protein [Thermoplasmata archaeon]MVT35544.1 ATP-binding cassette domain-containing protein [Euryarchaeota archaeon]
MNIVEAEGVKKYFPVKGSILRREKRFIKALDGVSLSIEKGEIYSIVGETGSGKTTLGRILIGLITPTEGSVKIDNIDIFSIGKSEMREIRKRVQIIFQDPYGSLNPRMRIRDIVSEPLKLNRMEYSTEKIARVMEDVGLKPASDFMDRYPHQLSGGQRQRVAIARALAISPEFIVADEPVSMLDVSIRANFLNMMREMNKKYNVSMLMITHDISVASYIGRRISVLYLGKVVEQGENDDIIKNPLHPYTRALMEAIATLGKKEKELHIKGEIPNPMDIPKGCRFHPRCPYAMDICREVEPDLVEISNKHSVACHLYRG